MPFVIDASVALGFCLKDEQGDYALAVLFRLQQNEAMVPAVWGLEVANGLLNAERRRRITAADIEEALELLAGLSITQDESRNEESLGSVLQLGRTENLSAYDASYLHLAMRSGLGLATQDTGLIAAATRVGVEVLS